MRDRKTPWFWMLGLVLAAGTSVASADELWSKADSPHVIGADLTIPAGTTVTIEAGATVDLRNGARLYVEGSLIGSGTTLDPIVFFGTGRLVGRGNVQLDHATFEVLVQPEGGDTQIVDSTFQGNGALSNWGAPTYMWTYTPFVRIERCVFDGAELLITDCHLLVRDVTVQNEQVIIGRGYVLLDGFVVDGSPFDGLWISEYEQPVYLDNLTVTNSADAALQTVAGNFLFGPGVDLQNNLYPLEMGGCGILPGSTLPATGNVNNHIKVDNFSNAVARMVWADPGIPYVIEDSYTGGALEILEGVTVQLKPNATFWGEPGFIDVRGLPGAPVTFERFDPAQSWQGLQYFHRYENVVIDGGQVGARFHSSSGPGFIDNGILSNNDFGSQNNLVARKTRFLNNGTGTWDNDWAFGLESATNPNGFVGNTLAVDAVGSVVDARYNWWGNPSGATAPDNPGGTGDSVSGPGVHTVPHATTEPDWSDAPPVVHLAGGTGFVEPGNTVILSWDSQDDQSVTGHRVEFYHPYGGVTVLADGLPASQHAFAWTVPDLGAVVNNVRPRIRVVAIDSSGQEGWDELRYVIPSGTIPGELIPTTDYTGTHRAGDALAPLCWDAVGMDPYASIYASLEFDGGRRGIPLGGGVQGCLALTPSAPLVSSDTVRVVLSASGGINHVNYFYGEYFTVRPDGRLGDAAPTITLLEPAGGETFATGAAIPVAWSAADDEGLRSLDVQASFDGGKTWHFVVEDLEPSATSFLWQLPPSGDIPDVRLRVMATDLRFQTSSDTTGAFAVSADVASCDQAPSEVQGLMFEDAAATMSWLPASTAEGYDLARGTMGELLAGAPVRCMMNGEPATHWTDPEIPSSGAVFFYIVRAANSCGQGPWGPHATSCE